jgi:hypothetical protein
MACTGAERRDARTHLVRGEDVIALPLVVALQQHLVVGIHHHIVDVERSARLDRKVKA